MPCPPYKEIPYIEAEIEKLDFRNLVDDKYKLLVRDELLKSNKFLDYITTDRLITDTEGLTSATDEDIINAKRKVILNDIFD